MRTILVVDDEVIFLDILHMLLQGAGYKVLTASDGLEAMEMVRRHRPDVALLDDMLPGMNGGEICLNIKQDPQLRHIPVILYSAGARVRDRSFVEHVGADAVLYKPFKPEDVKGVIQACLNSARA